MNASKTVWVALGMVLASGCQSSGNMPAPHATDAAVSSDASTPGDAGLAVNAHDTARAIAMFEPTVAAEAGADTPISLYGQADMWEHGEAVTLRLEIHGCKPGVSYQAHIQSGSDCSERTLSGDSWSASDGIDSIICTEQGGGSFIAYYARSPDSEKPWTIGGARSSNLVGHALIVSEVDSGRAVTCGVIGRAPDVPHSETTDTQGPIVQIRAAVANVCLFDRLVQKTEPNCPDYAAAVNCASTYCELDRCIDSCATYVKCLAQAHGLDICMAAFSCEPSEACSHCQSDVLRCEESVCQDRLSCAEPPTPGGPCTQLLDCCTRNNDGPATCQYTQQLARFGGDAECQRLIDDWNVRGDPSKPCQP